MSKKGQPDTDLTGYTFGRLSVIQLHSRHRYKCGLVDFRWTCKCTCGTVRIVLGVSLRRGETTSCGCFRSELHRAKMTSHGMSTTRTYRIWTGILTRCENTNDRAYGSYGARGITLCKRWHRFEKFIEDMGEAPLGLSIERIDNNKGYCPSNCKWATSLEQMRNRRGNVNITHNGKTQCVTAWACELGIKKQAIYARIYRGWPETKWLLPTSRISQPEQKAQRQARSR